ncbi:winged helix-turn-helix domain-containing protein [Kluyvera genomosp. 1]|uniref:winged helix-turn-helix domain-containing protein n=1 Tax=Kluyvera genomosp. 1 TaxID=2774053 RepID=UPI00068C4C6D|nr:winged helix-turn-helix domain-containing protein [Kluyvera genomosp. 1]
MIFTINGQIVFDSDTGMLGLIDTLDERVQISNPTKRLLLLLIQHQGEAVKREVIFKKVWDDFGMISSNNNLNQCVSKLRRLIKNFGLDDEAIVTIPKIGFMLHPQIELERGADIMLVPHEADASIDPDLEYPSESYRPERTLKEGKSSLLIRSNISLLILLIAIIALGAAIGIWFATKPLERREVFIGQAGTCKLLMSETLLQDDNSTALKSGVLSYAQRLKPQCTSDEYVLVIKSRTLRTWSRDLSRLYFMRCGTLRDSKSEVCWSITEPASAP